MKKLLPLLFGLFFIAHTQAQITLQPQDTSLLQMGTCGTSTDYIQKMNDAYTSFRNGAFNPDLAQPFHYTPQANYPDSLVITCGIFKFYYDDFLHAPAAGFADPTLGAVRRATLCAVFAEVQSKIHFVPGDTLDIYVDRSFSASNPYAATNGTLAFAGPSFPVSLTTTQGIYNGAFFDHTTSGVDPDPNNYDMSVTVNFHQTNNGGVSQPVNYNNDYTQVGGVCEYDLFSVLLHEVTHGMGFLSLVTEAATSTTAINGNSGLTFNNAYTRFDSLFLYKGNILTGVFDKIVDASTPGAPVLNPVINTYTNPIRSNDVWLYDNGNPFNQPIYSGVFYLQNGMTSQTSLLMKGSLLSHLNFYFSAFCGQAQYSPGFQPKYVMGPAFSQNELRRRWTNEELRCLLNLGYSLNTSYAASAAGLTILGNTPPHRTNPATPITEPNTGGSINMAEVPTFDYTITNNNSPTTPAATTFTISIPGLANVGDTEGDPISVAPGSLFGLRGVSTGGNNHNLLSLNPARTVVTYTPGIGYAGTAQFGFYLYDGKESGAFKTITINVLPGSFVPAAGDELLINGGYEDHTEVRLTTDTTEHFSTLTSGVLGEYLDGVHFAGGHPYSYLTNGWGPFGAGIIIQNALNDCGTTNGGINTFGAITSSSSFWMSWQNPVVHTTPVGNTAYTHCIYPNSPMHFTLMDSLRPGKYYISEFDISVANGAGVVNTVGTPYTYRYEGSDTVIGLPGLYTMNFSHTEMDTVRAVSNTFSISGNWVHVIDTFQYCSSVPSRYMIFRSPTLSSANLDNFTLREDTSQLPFDTVRISATAHVICAGDSITLTAVPNHIPDCLVTYIWNPGQDTAQSITVFPTNDTTIYYLTAIYAGFTLHDTDTVFVHPLPIMAVSPFNSTQCTGSTTLIASGADSTYQWSANAGSSTNDTVIVSPTVNTTYTVVGTTTFGCVDSISTTITIGSPPTVSVTPTSTTVCSGSGTTLTGSGATTYSWSPGAGLSATTGTTVTATPSVTTTYTVQGTASGCSSSVTTTVTVIPSATVTISPPADSICYGQVTTLTASLGAASYSWSDNTGVIATTNTVIVSPTASITTYTLHTTGSVGCPNLTYTTNVYVFGGPTLTVTPSSSTLCTVPSSSVTLTATGGVTTYTWDPPGGLSGINTPTVSASPTVTTTYTVSNQEPVLGCKTTGTATVNVVATPTVNVTPSPSYSICPGGSGTSLTASGATTYSWVPSTGLSATTGSVVTANPTVTTTYTVTGSTGGCSGTRVFTVTVNPAPTITVTPTSPQMCLGSPLTFTATGATSYTISPLGTTFTSTVSVNPSTTTTYTISGSNSFGCPNQNLTVRTVTVNPIPTITVTPTATTICNGVHQVITAGGAGVSGTYSWTPSSGLSATTGTIVTATPTITTTYTVTGTTVNTCTNTATSAITVIVVPTAVAPTSPTYCVGTPTQLIASGATSYSWTPSTGLSVTTGSIVTSTPTSTVPITYTVTGTLSGCTSNATATVSISPNTCMSATKKILGDTTIATNTTNFGLTPFTYSVTTMAIMGNVTIDTGTTTIACNDVRIAPGKLVTVKSGATLNVAWSYLHSCSTCGSGMWQGIYVENGGKLVITGGSRIEDADQAVYTQTWTSGTAIPDLQISQTIFNRNRTGIYLNLNGNPNNMQAVGANNVIDNCVFTCRDLSGISVATTTAIAVSKFNAIKADVYNTADSLTTTKAGTRSTYGVRLNTASSATYPYVIGEAGVTGSGGSGKLNIFDNLDYGVYSRASYYAVKNCQFQNSKGNNSGAMSGHGINSSDNNLSVGCFQLTTGVANEGCVFKNLLRGIHVQTTQRNYIRHNTFDNDTTSTTFSSGSNKGEYAMYLKPNGSFSATTTVDSNSINNCAIGIHINRSGNYAATGISVTNNTITAAGTTLKYCNKGIFLEDVVGSTTAMTSQTYKVESNTITKIGQKVIHCSNIQSGLWIHCNNELSLIYQTIAGGPISGGSSFDVIRLDNCKNSYTEGNLLIRTSSGNTLTANDALTGIYLNNSGANGNNNVITGNDIRNLGSCMVFEGSNPTATTIQYNVMTNGKYGLYMNTSAAFNTQPLTAANKWGTGSAFTKQTYNNNGGDINPSAKWNVSTASAGTGFTYSPTVHDYNASTSLIAYTSGTVTTNGFITSSTNPSPCTDCYEPCSTGGGTGGSFTIGGGEEMLAQGETGEEQDDPAALLITLLNDSNVSAPYYAQRSWLNAKWVYEQLYYNPSLYNENQALQDFYNAIENSGIGQLTKVEASINNGNFNNAQSILAQVTTGNAIEQSLSYVYAIELAYQLDSTYAADSLTLANLYTIASDCERTLGPAVRKARTLYNSIFNSHTAFADGCSEYTDARITHNTTEITKAVSFGLYPNPTSGDVYIYFDQLKVGETAVVEIYSTDGKQLNRLNLPLYARTSAFSLKELQNGVYICRLIKNGVLVSNERLVIMK